MTTITDEDLSRAQRLLEQATVAFEITREALYDTVERLKAEKAAGSDEVLKDLKQMNIALLTAMGMEEKARATEIRRTGGGGTGALDLDAARAEIGLRLACLRGPGGDGDVPVGPE